MGNYRNMNKLFIPFMVVVCLLLTACDEDKILPGGSMTWSWKILTPKNDVEFDLYWENKTTRILMIHQLSNDSDELAQEKYYLHIEPKS